MLKIFKNGLITGLIFQLAIGPVFFFILNLSIQKTFYDGFAGVIAVTLVDYLYIALALFGVGKLLEKKKIKKAFGIMSAIVLTIFGILIIKNILSDSTIVDINTDTTNILSSFTAVFLLTISSPMTIVFWTGLFAAKAMEYNYSKRELLIFGLATGLATLIFMGTSVIFLSVVKKTVPLLLIQTLNIIVGCLLILYGGMRLKTILKENI